MYPTVKNYVISVSKKRQLMFETLNDISCEYVGVDASDLPDDICDRYNEFVINNEVRSSTKLLRKNEIACAMGHIEAMHRILDSENCLGGIIMEDDVKIDYERYTSVTNELAMDHRFENSIILLGGDTTVRYFDCRSTLGEAKIFINIFTAKKIGGVILGVPLDRVYGAYGYFIGRKAARFFTQNVELVFDRADYITTNAPYYGIRLFSVFNPIVYHIYENNPSILGNKQLNTIRYGFLKSLLRLCRRHTRGCYNYIRGFHKNRLSEN